MASISKFVILENEKYLSLNDRLESTTSKDCLGILARIIKSSSSTKTFVFKLVLLSIELVLLSSPFLNTKLNLVKSDIYAIAPIEWSAKLIPFAPGL